MKAGIYLITSPSGKKYVGQAVDLEKRMTQYKGLHCKEQPYLLNSLKKHSFEQHKITFLFQCNRADFEREFLKDLLNDLETEFILAYNTFVDHDPKGMNLTTGGGVCVVSEETKAKQSAWQKGKIITEETKAKLSEANKGKKRSAETRAKISVLQKEYQNRPEIKAKMSEARKGRIHTAESRAKMSEAKQNMTVETKIRMSEAQKGKKISAETKAKMSETKKGKRKGDKNPSHIAKIKRYNEKLQRLRERKDIFEPLNVPRIIGIQSSIF